MRKVFGLTALFAFMLLASGEPTTLTATLIWGGAILTTMAVMAVTMRETA